MKSDKSAGGRLGTIAISNWRFFSVRQLLIECKEIFVVVFKTHSNLNSFHIVVEDHVVSHTSFEFKVQCSIIYRSIPQAVDNHPVRFLILILSLLVLFFIS